MSNLYLIILKTLPPLKKFPNIVNVFYLFLISWSDEYNPTI